DHAEDRRRGRAEGQQTVAAEQAGNRARLGSEIEVAADHHVLACQRAAEHADDAGGGRALARALNGDIDVAGDVGPRSVDDVQLAAESALPRISVLPEVAVGVL